MKHFTTENLIYQTLTKLDESGENEVVTQAMSIVRILFEAEREGRKLSPDEAYEAAIAAEDCG